MSHAQGHEGSYRIQAKNYCASEYLNFAIASEGRLLHFKIAPANSHREGKDSRFLYHFERFALIH